MTTSPFDTNEVMLTGENPFIRLSETDGGDNTTDASFWRVLFCPGGPGHVLFLKSELTEGEVRIYSDNINMTRWLQSTVQGVINPESGDQDIPVVDATFECTGDLRSFWTEMVYANDAEVALTWYDLGQPMILHTQPNSTPGRPYGVCTLFVPAGGARLTVNGVQAKGRAWSRERDGRTSSTSSLAFAESWTQAV